MHKHRMLEQHEQERLCLPFKSKLLSLKGGKANTKDDSNTGGLAEMGINRTSEDFQQVATSLKHPFDGDSTVPDDIKRAIFLDLDIQR